MGHSARQDDDGLTSPAAGAFLSAMNQADLPWPRGDDAMAARIRAFDWGATPLGAITTWSERLKIMVEQTLASTQVSSLVCGPKRILIYNAAAAALYGIRHPAALGRPLPETFPEGWATVAPHYARAFAGEAVEVKGQHLDTRGEGAARDVFDALLMPVRETDGHIAYVHMIGSEISEQPRNRQSRIVVLRSLGLLQRRPEIQ